MTYDEQVEAVAKALHGEQRREREAQSIILRGLQQKAHEAREARS